MGATIKDIAARTGLGLATISKYLNGGHVLDKNKELIEEAITALDFKVNHFARSLKTKQSRTVGVVIPQLNNLFMTSLVTKIEETLREKGYGVLVCDTARQQKREEEVFHFLMDKMVDGIILMTTTNQSPGAWEAVRNKIPVVLIDRKLSDMEGKLDMVLVDNYKAAYESTEYLLKKGHKKIAMLLGSEQIYTALERKRGYEAALEKANICTEAAWIRYTGFSMEGSYQQTKALLMESPEITAIFATNFEMTLGALLALKDSGLRVPEDISLLGFDNRELARAMQPGLTIVTQPVEEMGVKAAELLLERMHTDSDPAARNIVLEATLEEGASVRTI